MKYVSSSRMRSGWMEDTSSRTWCMEACNQALIHSQAAEYGTLWQILARHGRALYGTSWHDKLRHKIQANELNAWQRKAVWSYKILKRVKPPVTAN